MKKYSLITWILCNAFGLGIGFLLYLQIGMILSYGLNTEMSWQWIPPEQDFMTYVGILISALILGAFVGLAQSLILKSKQIKALSWVIITSIGFGLMILINWPLLFFDVLGKIPGPVEPIIVTVAGSIFAGVIQYLWLRKKGIYVEKWLFLWILGLIFSLVPTAIFFSLIEVSSWPMETFLSGFLVGGFATWISGKALFNKISLKS